MLRWDVGPPLGGTGGRRGLASAMRRHGGKGSVVIERNEFICASSYLRTDVKVSVRGTAGEVFA